MVLFLIFAALPSYSSNNYEKNFDEFVNKLKKISEYCDLPSFGFRISLDYTLRSFFHKKIEGIGIIPFCMCFSVKGFHLKIIEIAYLFFEYLEISIPLFYKDNKTWNFFPELNIRLYIPIMNMVKFYINFCLNRFSKDNLFITFGFAIQMRKDSTTAMMIHPTDHSIPFTRW